MQILTAFSKTVSASPLKTPRIIIAIPSIKRETHNIFLNRSVIIDKSPLFYYLAAFCKAKNEQYDFII